MTLLSIIQDHCRIHALNVPSTVVNSTDTTIQQLFGIAKECHEDTIDQSKWQGITREALFNTAPSEDQGALSTLAPFGFMWLYPKTLYNRTLKRALYGPLNEQEWQATLAITNPGPFYKFRLRGNHLLLTPTPGVDPHLIAFEYASSFAVNASDGTPKAAFTSDSDTWALPEKILRKGIMFRWKQVKGLPYQVDELAYWTLVNSYIARDKVPRSYNMAEGSSPDLSPGIFVPSGNWPSS
jgi:hypothetical protein